MAKDKKWIRQIAKSDQEELKKFVSLERELLGSYPHYIPSIDDDIIYQLSGQSPFFSEMEHTMFVASNGKQIVARCAALINRKYQKAKDEAVGFIGYFASAPENNRLVMEMLAQAETWLKERGVKRIIAPYNGALFLDWGDWGFLTAEFDEEPLFPFKWHPPYYKDYITEAGFNPSYPLWSYMVDFSSEKYLARVQQVKGNQAARVRPIDKNNWDEEMEIQRSILNEAFRNEWETYPLNRDEFLDIYNPLKEFLDPRQILVAEINNEPVGICVGYPDINHVWKSFGGSIGNVETIKNAFANFKRAGLLIIAVLPEAQGHGVAQLLAVTLFQRYQEHGLKEAAYHLVNEVNEKSRKFAEALCCEGRKLYHCYDKIIG